MGKIFKHALEAMGILAAGLCIGTLLLMAAYSLPAEKMREHAMSAAEIFEKEGDHPALFFNVGAKLDNWTDAIMLLNAIYSGEESSLEKAMLVPRRQSMYADAYHTLIGESRGKIGEEDYYVAPYSRYWHGYLIFLKPLLLFLDYGDIRIFHLILQTILTAGVLVVMWQRNFKYCMIPYAVSVLSVMPVDNAFSMQYADVAYLISAGTLVLLLCSERWKGKHWYYICYFIVMGMLTSYFDFLTYPVLTFGIPMCVCLCIRPEDGLQSLKSVIRNGLGWCWGYSGMWAGKWLLATLVTGDNVLQEAQESALYRIYGGGEVPVSGAALVCSAVARNAGWWSLVPAFGVIAAVPFVWYGLLRSHSYVHYWMTYKDLGAVCMAFTCLCVCALDKRRQS